MDDTVRSDTVRRAAFRLHVAFVNEEGRVVGTGLAIFVSHRMNAFSQDAA